MEENMATNILILRFRMLLQEGLLCRAKWLGIYVNPHLIYIYAFLRQNNKLEENVSPLTNPRLAFGSYFCSNGFRKTYSVASYTRAYYLEINFKVLLIIAQTIGYVTHNGYANSFSKRQIPPMV